MLSLTGFVLNMLQNFPEIKTLTWRVTRCKTLVRRPKALLMSIYVRADFWEISETLILISHWPKKKNSIKTIHQLVSSRVWVKVWSKFIIITLQITRSTNAQKTWGRVFPNTRKACKGAFWSALSSINTNPAKTKPCCLHGERWLGLDFLPGAGIVMWVLVFSVSKPAALLNLSLLVFLGLRQRPLAPERSAGKGSVFLYLFGKVTDADGTGLITIAYQRHRRIFFFFLKTL